MPTQALASVVVDDRGVAYLKDTTTKVSEVVLVQETSGLPAERLPEELPHLTLAQVYAALAYYHDHKAELDAEIRRREQRVEDLRAQTPEPPLVRRLRAEGRLP